MLLSDISVRRPVLATVFSLLLVAFGLVAFDRLPLREYPDIDPPVVSIDTRYPGASAAVVETRITKVIEDRISGVEGIKYIESASEDGRSRVTVEFSVERDIDAAANDIRDRVSRVRDSLPREADAPDIQKVDADDSPIIWLNLVSTEMTLPELTDYAERYLVDSFSVLPGVARVRVGGAQSYALRIWLNRQALAAQNLTVAEVEAALRSENVELPAGSIESLERQFTVRVDRSFRAADDFKQLVLRQGTSGYLVRLADVARVEMGTVESRTLFRGNGEPMVGLGISKQSTANTIDVARNAREAMARINPTLPQGMAIKPSYDSSVFIEASISEVYKTLFIAIGLVVLVIYLFLGSLRAMLIPAVTVPVSLIATAIVLFALGFTINLLTLLALVLAIGLVVDDSIVVLENIHRRIEDKRESPLVASFKGTRQVGFAVISTTVLLVAVFIPITFLEGDLGQLFTEFALTLSAAVVFSSFVALSLSPVLATSLLKANSAPSAPVQKMDHLFNALRTRYSQLLDKSLARPWLLAGATLALLASAVFFEQSIPREYVPKEDRGAFFVIVSGPEGASYAHTVDYMNEIEQRLQFLLDDGEAQRLLVRAPRSFGNLTDFSGGIVIVTLSDWSERRSAWDIMTDVRNRLSDLPGIRAFPVMRQGIRGGTSKPVQFVLGGATYAELANWRDQLNARIQADNPGLTDIDWDYKETKPQYKIAIDYDRAAELGVTVNTIGTTLESLLGSRRVTTFIDQGEEYDVIIEGERSDKRSPTDLQNIYVRSSRSQQLIPLANLVTLEAFADAGTLSRYNRIRAITLEANVEGVSLGEALNYLTRIVAEELPEYAQIDYKGDSLDYTRSGQSVAFIFALGLIVVFLVLAAQFESFVHPMIIMLTVPLAMAGGLFGLWSTGNSLNIYSQIALLMLIGLAAKNGILIVEFANQLRSAGRTINEAIREAAAIRLRPIVMTSITTMAGAVPLIISFGAGAETRTMIGVTLFYGVLAATLFTLFIVPTAYNLFAKHAAMPGARATALDRALSENESR
ncbi:efflux RND transporter permease subunit [Simiduia sp. 21SJ11W-1]|uniref:efflux RND transporter permease subunit n=1 Tax=Simiduia sp. 21SJ11W-1 TaxID=2909669 RepID=UPI00209E4A42|nr:efflux RND transporter permease subunit [Simiduia sp. 21SJ11W-1]UTA49039.1 efflux RND transporter permease subunit [Simiduia sp. 21SJ11W-1]